MRRYARPLGRQLLPIWVLLKLESTLQGGVWGAQGGLVAQFLSVCFHTPRSEQHRRWPPGWGVCPSLQTSPSFPAAMLLGAGYRCCKVTSGGCRTPAASGGTSTERGGQGCSDLSAIPAEPVQPRHCSIPAPLAPRTCLFVHPAGSAALP